ncbi:predicted protein [Sclerotinia sclerotiorum 1980 UF-70]|uniref:Uncharacterized protein n=1 Tax=Sclerotinia sclerotiorum (strain ATCC 18683 / 1980 / Ss-1) TaxID=665079 RepID=A7EJE9_SCLS1|nr:predicted protein [Sclerotinia sclerotiorum 1980 UF-70]EDO02965.1 predicted protein [Sclerotinia sclerotiorum 1980 UF-70]
MALNMWSTSKTISQLATMYKTGTTIDLFGPRTKH